MYYAAISAKEAKMKYYFTDYEELEALRAENQNLTFELAKVKAELESLKNKKVGGIKNGKQKEN